MIVKHEKLNGIPVLHAYDEDMKLDAPITIFLHGFMSAKEHNLHYAYNLVEKGVRVILPEAYLHGERAQNLHEHEMSLKFWEIVLTSIAEVGVIKNALTERDYTGKIAVVGTSMGGITTVGCLTKYNWISTAGVLMGAVSFPQFLKLQFEQLERDGIEIPLTQEQIVEVNALLAPYDGYANENYMTKIPVYMWHGERDAVVPISMTRPFIEQLEEKNIPHNITYVVDGRSGHAVSRKGILDCTQFIAQHLA